MSLLFSLRLNDELRMTSALAIVLLHLNMLCHFRIVSVPGLLILEVGSRDNFQISAPKRDNIADWQVGFLILACFAAYGPMTKVYFQIK